MIGIDKIFFMFSIISLFVYYFMNILWYKSKMMIFGNDGLALLVLLFQILVFTSATETSGGRITGEWKYVGRTAFWWNRVFFNQGITVKTPTEVYITGTNNLYKTSNTFKILNENNDPLGEVNAMFGDTVPDYAHVGDNCVFDNGLLLVPLESKLKKTHNATFAVFNADSLELIYSAPALAKQKHASFTACSDSKSGSFYSTEWGKDEQQETGVNFLHHYSFDGTEINHIRAIPLSETIRGAQGGTVISDEILLLSLGATGDLRQYILSVNLTSGNVEIEKELKISTEMEGISNGVLLGTDGNIHFLTGFSLQLIYTLVGVFLGSAVCLIPALVYWLRKYLLKKQNRSFAPLPDSGHVERMQSFDMEMLHQPLRKIECSLGVVFLYIGTVACAFVISFLFGVLAAGPVHYIYHYNATFI